MAPPSSKRPPLKERDAAIYIGMSSAWLRAKRHYGDPDQPPYIRMGGGSIRYLPEDLDDWLLKHRVDFGEAAIDARPSGEARR
jgi:predicted DNA-binding transcriptional regulator AlpA